MAAQTFCFNISGSAQGIVTVTSWPSYAFTRIWRVGNKFFGIAKNGVFELKGNTDDTTVYSSKFRLSRNTLKTNALKRVPYVRLNNNTSGTATAIADMGVSVSSITFTNAERVKFGRGLKGRTFAFEIETTVADFNIQNMEIFEEKLQRGVD